MDFDGQAGRIILGLAEPSLAERIAAHPGTLPQDPKDAWHARVLAWEAAHPNARFVTTEEVLSELLTWFAGTGPVGRAYASTVVRSILGDPSTHALPQTSVDFAAANPNLESTKVRKHEKRQ